MIATMAPEFFIEIPQGENANKIRNLAKQLGAKITENPLPGEYSQTAELSDLPNRDGQLQVRWFRLVKRYRPNVDAIRCPDEKFLEASNIGLRRLLHDAFEHKRAQKIVFADLSAVREVLANKIDASLQPEIPAGVTSRKGRGGFYFCVSPYSTVLLPLQVSALEKKYGLIDGRIRKHKEIALELGISEAVASSSANAAVSKIYSFEELRTLIKLQ